MGKHEKYRVLLTFNCLSKNVKKAILTYNSTRFNRIDKKNYEIIANDCKYSVRY